MLDKLEFTVLAFMNSHLNKSEHKTLESSHEMMPWAFAGEFNHYHIIKMMKDMLKLCSLKPTSAIGNSSFFYSVNNTYHKILKGLFLTEASSTVVFMFEGDDFI
jgi:hypothetical protein